MHRYTVSKTLGDGTYGSVFKAVSKETGDVVAVKVMKRKFSSWTECVQLREVKALRALSHPNIVRLKEVIRESNGPNAGQLFMAFECLDMNLFEAAKARAEAAVAAGKPRSAAFPEKTIRNLLWQLLQALAYMHRNGYWHRDVKPENCLLRMPIPSASYAYEAGTGAASNSSASSSSTGTGPSTSASSSPFAPGLGDTYLLKLADFGLARELRSRPPYTQYVSTRWYRAPEVLLRDPAYSSGIDIFAVGCIAAELYNCAPLFPGASEVDQLSKLVGVLGSPNNGACWPEGIKLAAKLGFAFPPAATTSATSSSSQQYAELSGFIPTASPDALDLISKMLAWNPAHRPNAADCLRHPYFTRQFAVGGPSAGLATEGADGGMVCVTAGDTAAKPAGAVPFVASVPKAVAALAGMVHSAFNQNARAAPVPRPALLPDIELSDSEDEGEGVGDADLGVERENKWVARAKGSPLTADTTASSLAMAQSRPLGSASSTRAATATASAITTAPEMDSTAAASTINQQHVAVKGGKREQNDDADLYADIEAALSSLEKKAAAAAPAASGVIDARSPLKRKRTLENSGGDGEAQSRLVSSPHKRAASLPFPSPAVVEDIFASESSGQGGAGFMPPKQPDSKRRPPADSADLQRREAPLDMDALMDSYAGGSSSESSYNPMGGAKRGPVRSPIDMLSAKASALGSSPPIDPVAGPFVLPRTTVASPPPQVPLSHLLMRSSAASTGSVGSTSMASSSAQLLPSSSSYVSEQDQLQEPAYGGFSDRAPGRWKEAAGLSATMGSTLRGQPQGEASFASPSGHFGNKRGRQQGQGPAVGFQPQQQQGKPGKVGAGPRSNSSSNAARQAGAPLTAAGGGADDILGGLGVSGATVGMRHRGGSSSLSGGGATTFGTTQHALPQASSSYAPVSAIAAFSSSLTPADVPPPYQHQQAQHPDSQKALPPRSKWMQQVGPSVGLSQGGPTVGARANPNSSGFAASGNRLSSTIGPGSEIGSFAAPPMVPEFSSLSRTSDFGGGAARTAGVSGGATGASGRRTGPGASSSSSASFMHDSLSLHVGGQSAALGGTSSFLPAAPPSSSTAYDTGPFGGGGGLTGRSASSASSRGHSLEPSAGSGFYGTAPSARSDSRMSNASGGADETSQGGRRGSRFAAAGSTALGLSGTAGPVAMSAGREYAPGASRPPYQQPLPGRGGGGGGSGGLSATTRPSDLFGSKW